MGTRYPRQTAVSEQPERQILVSIGGIVELKTRRHCSMGTGVMLH